MSRYRHEVQEGYEKRDLISFLCDFDNIYSADFYHRTKIWRDIFGDRVLIRRYETMCGDEGGLIRAFFKLMGRDVADMGPCVREERKIASFLLDAVRILFADPNLADRRSAILEKIYSLGEEIGDLSIMHLQETIALPETIRKILQSIKMDDIVFGAMPEQ